MEFNEFIRKISDVQKKALKDAVQAKMNEGYTLDELEVTYETKMNRKPESINAVITYEIKAKTDAK